MLITVACRFFAEAFLRGDSDPDWNYIIRGIVFGFQVINDDCLISYRARPKRIKSPVFRKIIEDKLKREIDEEEISLVSEPPICSHGIFCVPKEGGKADELSLTAVSPQPFL